jgi:DNA-binding CsgD family transcriptional regulator
MANHRKSFDVDGAVEMYLAGLTLQRIAERYGVVPLTVRKRLAERGVFIRKPGPRDASAAQAHQRRLTDEQERDVACRYRAGELAHEIAESIGVGRKTVSNALRRQGVRTRDKRESQAHLNSRRRAEGKRHPNFRGGRSVTLDGYVLVGIDETDPLWPMATERRRKNYAGYIGTGYVLEHRLVLARDLGRPLTASETVHHKNGKRDDNRIENLELRIGNHGRGATEAHCPTCTCFK